VGRLAAATLADLGHRQIAFIDATKTATNAAYECGFRREFEDRGIPTSDLAVLYGEHFLIGPEVEYAEELVQHVLDAPARFTAVFCADDYLSERLYVAAMDRGLRVPEDLSIIGFGPTHRDGALRAKLAAVTIDEITAGRRAAQLLNEMRTGRRPLDSDEVVTLPVNLVKGRSLGAPPDKSNQ
jgi:DNA-binding LacI/PurR family transcriptional regulator